MKRYAVALLGAEIALAASFAVSGMAGLSGRAYAEPSLANDGTEYVTGPDGYTVHVDALTGARIQEDDPRWNCVTDGDRQCGPGNANGVPAGCYDDGGVIVAYWPCFVVPDANGEGHVFTPDPRN